MVCYHDIHVTPRTRSGWIRAATRDVLKWFNDLALPNRVEFICGLLQLLAPSELRFYGSCLEELARLHYDELRELDIQSNSVIDPKDEDCLTTFFKHPSYGDPQDRGCSVETTKLDIKRSGMNPLPSSFHVLTSDSFLRSKLILRLSLLRSTNFVSAQAYFDALMADDTATSSTATAIYPRDQTRLSGSASYPTFSSKWQNGISSDESEDETVRSNLLTLNELKAIDEILLIYTLAAFHPAFTFDQRQRLYTYLCVLRAWSDSFRGQQSQQQQQIGKFLSRPTTHNTATTTVTVPASNNTTVGRHNSSMVCHMCGVVHQQHQSLSSSHSCPNDEASDQQPDKNCAFQLTRSDLKTACSAVVDRDVPFSLYRWLRCVRRGSAVTHHRRFHSLSLEDLALLETFHTKMTEHQLIGDPSISLGDDSHLVSATQHQPPSSPALLVTVGRRRGRAGPAAIATYKQEDGSTAHPSVNARCPSCNAPHPSESDQTGISTTNNLISTFKSSTMTSPVMTEGLHSVKQPPRFSLDGQDDGLLHEALSSTESDSSVALTVLRHPTTIADTSSCSSDDPNSTSTRTLTASDRISMIRDLVLSTNELSLTPRNPRPDRRETTGSAAARLTGPSTSRFSPPDNDMDFHFGLGKHNKDVTDYCRLTPKRHSSGSSPISTPPSEDSGSETISLTTTTSSSTSAYWDRKNSDTLSTISIYATPPTITSVVTAGGQQPPCLTCHQCQPVCVTTVMPTHSFFQSNGNKSEMRDLTDASQPSVLSTPTKQQQQQTQNLPGNQGSELRSASQKGCTYCRQTDSHSNCILSTSTGSEHRTCNQCYRMTNNNHTTPTHSGCQNQTTNSAPVTADRSLVVVSTRNIVLPSKAHQEPTRTTVAPNILDAETDKTSLVPVSNHKQTENDDPSKDYKHTVLDDNRVTEVKKPAASNSVSHVSTIQSSMEVKLSTEVPGEIIEVTNRVVTSTRSSVICPAAVCAPHHLNDANRGAHFLDPSFYTQSYVIPSSNLWITPQPGTPWTSVLPPCITAAALPTPLPSHFASVSEPLELKDSVKPLVDSTSVPAVCNAQFCVSESIQSNSTVSISTMSEPTPNAPPAATLVAPQAFIMLYPPAPLDVFPTSFLPLDLITGQPVQYISLNPPVPTSLHIDSAPNANGAIVTECNSFFSTTNPDPRQNIPDVPVIPEGSNVAATTTTTTGTVISKSSGTSASVSMERQQGSHALLDQSNFQGPTAKSRSMSRDPSASNEPIQSLLSRTNVDMHANLTWSNPTASLPQQHRPSFRPELAAHLPSGLRMRSVSSYANRAFHAPPPQPLPPTFASTVFNGPFASRHFLPPQMASNGGSNNTSSGLYHSNLPSSSMFQQVGVNSSFATHASSAQTPSSSYLVNLSGQLLSLPSTVPVNFPQPPPPPLLCGRMSASPSPCCTFNSDPTKPGSAAPLLVMSAAGFCSTSSTCAGMTLVPSTTSPGSAPTPLSSVELGPIYTSSISLNSTNATTVTSTGAVNSSVPVIYSSISNTTSTTTTTTAVSASFHHSSAPQPPPSFLPTFFLHQPPLLPPIPPTHPNYFLPQQPSTPLLAPHGHTPAFTMPFWPPVPVHHGPASVVGTMHAHRTVSCYNCGQPGHKAKQCPSRLPNQQALENTFNLSFAPNK